MTEASKSVGPRPRWWRDRRGLSQLDLAGAAGTTQRHLSFLESGRAMPSRDMILRLAAGYAPVWRESDLSALELARVTHDVTLQEIRIECFFPADDATARAFHAWAELVRQPA